MAADDTSSLRFGNFEILTRPDGAPHELGRGGFGRTFKARHGFLGTEVALKVIHERMAFDQAAKGRFLKEAQAQARLRHPGIAAISDFGEVEGNFYYALELCPDGDLKDLVKRTGPLAPHEALHFILQAAEALTYAYGQGLSVHGDIKPGNILLVIDGNGVPQLKLIDFGLVQMAAQNGEDEQEGPAMWSPAFASPEQIKEEKLDWRSDFFSLGMTAWFLAAGGGPMEGSAADLTRERLSTTSYAAMLPAALTGGMRDVIARLIEKDPAKRYRDAASAVAAMRESLAGSPPLGGDWRSRKRTGAALKDRFHLEPAGRSYLGEIFRGYDRQTNLLVRITLVKSTHPARLVDQAMQRARALLEVQSPGLMPLVEAGEFTEGWAVVEEEITGALIGETLKREGAVQLARIAGVLWEAACGLDAAAACGALPAALEQAILEHSTAGQPVDWNAVQLRIPVEMVMAPASHSTGSDVTAASDVTVDAESASPLKGFSRLVYYMVGGRQVRMAALYSSASYIAIPGLSGPGNDLLAKSLAGESHHADCRTLIQALLSAEGVPVEAAITRVKEAMQRAFLNAVQRESARVSQSSAASAEMLRRAAPAASGTESTAALQAAQQAFATVEDALLRIQTLEQTAPECREPGPRRLLLTELRSLAGSAEAAATLTIEKAREAHDLGIAAKAAAERLARAISQARHRLTDMAAEGARLATAAESACRELQKSAAQSPSVAPILPEAESLLQLVRTTSARLAALERHGSTMEDEESLEDAVSQADATTSELREAAGGLEALRRQGVQKLEAWLAGQQLKKSTCETILRTGTEVHRALEKAAGAVEQIAALQSPEAEQARRALSRGNVIAGQIDDLHTEASEAEDLTPEQWAAVSRETAALQSQVMASIQEATQNAQAAAAAEKARQAAVAAAAAAAEKERKTRLEAAGAEIVRISGEAEGCRKAAFELKMPPGFDRTALERLQLETANAAKACKALVPRIKAEQDTSAAAAMVAEAERLCAQARRAHQDAESLTIETQKAADEQQRIARRVELTQKEQAEAARIAAEKAAAAKAQAEEAAAAAAEQKRIKEKQDAEREAQERRRKEAEALARENAEKERLKIAAEAAKKQQEEAARQEQARKKKEADDIAKKEAAAKKEAEKLAREAAENQKKADAKRQREQEAAAKKKLEEQQAAQAKRDKELRLQQEADERESARLAAEELRRDEDAKRRLAEANRQRTEKPAIQNPKSIAPKAISPQSSDAGVISGIKIPGLLEVETAPQEWGEPVAPRQVPVRRRSVLGMGAAAAAVAAVGGGAWFFLRPKPEPENTLTKDKSKTVTQPPPPPPEPVYTVTLTGPLPPTPTSVTFGTKTPVKLPAGPSPWTYTFRMADVPIPLPTAEGYTFKLSNETENSINYAITKLPPPSPPAALTFTLHHEENASTFYRSATFTPRTGQPLEILIESGKAVTRSKVPPGVYKVKLNPVAWLTAAPGGERDLIIAPGDVTGEIKLPPIPPEICMSRVQMTGPADAGAVAPLDDSVRGRLPAFSGLNETNQNLKETSEKAWNRLPPGWKAPAFVAKQRLTNAESLPVILNFTGKGATIHSPSMLAVQSVAFKTLDLQITLVILLRKFGLEDEAANLETYAPITGFSAYAKAMYDPALLLESASSNEASIAKLNQSEADPNRRKVILTAYPKLKAVATGVRDFWMNHLQEGQEANPIPDLEPGKKWASISCGDNATIDTLTGAVILELPPEKIHPGLTKAQLTLQPPPPAGGSWSTSIALTFRGESPAPLTRQPVSPLTELPPAAQE